MEHRVFHALPVTPYVQKDATMEEKATENVHVTEDGADRRVLSVPKRSLD